MPQRVGNRHSRAVARRISYERTSGFAYQKEKSIWRVRFHPHGIFEKPKNLERPGQGEKTHWKRFQKAGRKIKFNKRKENYNGKNQIERSCTHILQQV